MDACVWPPSLRHLSMLHCATKKSVGIRRRAALDIGGVVFMGVQKVTLQVRLLPEALFAVRTPKWPLACVSPEVANKLRFIRERLGTEVTHPVGVALTWGDSVSHEDLQQAMVHIAIESHYGGVVVVGCGDGGFGWC